MAKDFAFTYDHYTSPDLNYNKHSGIATESLSVLPLENTMPNAENFQNLQIYDMAGISSGSAADHSV